MKKFFVFLVLALLISGSAFALQCEESQSAGGPEACWTTATLSNAVTSTILTNGVSAGSVFVYDTASGQLGQNSTLSLAQTGATLVKLSSVSADNTRVAGVLQTSLDSSKVSAGSRVRLLVRGLGDIIMTGQTGAASGDALIVRATAGAGGALGGAGVVGGETVNGTIGTALETYTTATAAKKKAIIKVI